MRDFAHVQAQAFEQDFGIGGESTGTQLGARIMRFFQKQDAVGEMRGTLYEVQGGGEARRSTAEDEYVVIHGGIVLPPVWLVKSSLRFG